MVEKPDGYKAPSLAEVWGARRELQARWRGFFDAIGEVKEMRRHEYDAALSEMDEEDRARAAPYSLKSWPAHADYIDRRVGLVASHDPKFTVVAGSDEDEAQREAGYEERCLNAVFRVLRTQQGRDTYHRLVDSVIAFGVGCASLFPDAEVIRAMGGARERGADEGPEAYVERIAGLVGSRVPFVIRDHDPETVMPLYGEREDLEAVVCVTSHSMLDVQYGMGYKPVGRGEMMGTWGWEKGGVLFEGEVSPELSGYGVERRGSDYSSEGRKVEKMVWCDKWTYRTWLDDVLVEDWQHDLGFVPYVFAYGMPSVDRDPEFANRGLGYNALRVAQILAKLQARVMNTAIRYSNPILTAEGDWDGDENQKELKFSKEVTVFRRGLVDNIQAPFTNVNMPVDFVQQQALMDNLHQTTTSPDFGRGVDKSLSGYATSQLSSQTTTQLRPIYTSLRVQMAMLGELVRAWTVKCFPGGFKVQALVEEKEGGEAGGKPKRVREMLEYGESKMTGGVIEVEIDEGVPQDEWALRKGLLELQQAGAISWLRMTEEMGMVDDPVREQDRIEQEMIRKSPEIQRQIVTQALNRLGMREAAAQAAAQSPERQALGQAQQAHFGGGVMPGMNPGNEGMGGVPMNQQLGSANPGGSQMKLNLPAAGGPQQTPSGPRM